MSIVKNLDFHGNKVIQFSALTVPRLRKGNPWGLTTKHSLRKVARVTSMIGPEGLYSWLVNIARTLEGSPVDSDGSVQEFIANQRVYGKYVRRHDGTTLPYVEHNGVQYLPMSIISSQHHEYRLENGSLVEKSEVAEWLPEVKEGKRQELPIEKIIRWRNYKIENLGLIKVGTEICEGKAKDVMAKLLENDQEGAEFLVLK